MAPRTLAPLFALLLLIAAPLAVAQEDPTVSVDVLAGDTAVQEVDPGQLLSLVANVTAPQEDNTTWRAFLNASVGGTLIQGSQQQIAGGGSFQLLSSFNVPQDARGNLSVSYTVTVQSKALPASQPGSGGNDTGNQTGNETGNQTSEGSQEDQQANATWQTRTEAPGEITLTVQPPVAPPTGPPIVPIVGGIVLVLLVAGGIVAYVKWPRQYQAEGGPRSKTLKEMEGGDGGGGGGGAGAATAQTVTTQEPEVHPQVKILQARAEDVKRMIELARQRHERGDITEHQFEMIRKKKEAELEQIEEEIDSYRSA